MKLRLAVLAMTVALAGCESSEHHLVGTLERDRVEIPAELSEPVIALHVTEGASVQAGDPLLALDDTRAVAELERLRALREMARRQLDEQLRGPREEEIRQGRARLDAAEGRLETALREYERLQPLAQQGLASQAALDAARAALDTARGERDAARAHLDALLEGTTVEQLDQARAQLAAAEAAVTRQEVMVDRLSVEAPRDGVVEALPWKAGSQPPRGAAVAVLLTGEAYVRTYIPVSERARYLKGTEVRVHVPGFGEYAGRVRWVSAEAAFTPYFALTEHDRDRLSHAAEIALAGEDAAALPAGVPVDIHAADSDE